MTRHTSTTVAMNQTIHKQQQLLRINMINDQTEDFLLSNHLSTILFAFFVFSLLK